MNLEKILLIEDLAEIALKKRKRFNALSMANVQQDLEKRKQQAIQYALARAEWLEAEKELDKAIQA